MARWRRLRRTQCYDGLYWIGGLDGDETYLSLVFLHGDGDGLTVQPIAWETGTCLVDESGEWDAWQGKAWVKSFAFPAFPPSVRTLTLEHGLLRREKRG